MSYPSDIESHFQGLRGPPGFMLSPEDWKRACAWERAGIPLVAVIRGLDAAFLAHKGMRERSGLVNSLAFCERFVKAQRVPVDVMR